MGANAQTSVPAFTAGQVLTAAQMTEVNTGIPVFASSTERDAAFGGTGEKTLAEGQYAFLEDTNETQVYDGSTWGAVAGGKILQVVSTTKTDTYSVSIGLRQFAGSNVTGLDTTITPSSTGSKILVIPMIYVGAPAARAIFRINRDGSPIAVGDSAGSRSLVTGRNYGVGATSELALGSMMHLDAPATTSATTYGVELFNDSGSTQTQYVNRSDLDTDAIQFSRTVSSLTLLEVSA